MSARVQAFLRIEIVYQWNMARYAPAEIETRAFVRL